MTLIVTVSFHCFSLASHNSFGKLGHLRQFKEKHNVVRVY